MPHHAGIVDDENPRLGLPGFVAHLSILRPQPSRRYALDLALMNASNAPASSSREIVRVTFVKMPGFEIACQPIPLPRWRIGNPM